MPAEPDRRVLARILDADDRELRVSLVSWPEKPAFGTQVELADFIPSQQRYGRGFLFDPRHLSKVMAGLREAKAAS